MILRASVDIERWRSNIIYRCRESAFQLVLSASLCREPSVVDHRCRLGKVESEAARRLGVGVAQMKSPFYPRSIVLLLFAEERRKRQGEKRRLLQFHFFPSVDIIATCKCIHEQYRHDRECGVLSDTWTCLTHIDVGFVTRC